MRIFFNNLFTQYHPEYLKILGQDCLEDHRKRQ